MCAIKISHDLWNLEQFVTNSGTTVLTGLISATTTMLSIAAQDTQSVECRFSEQYEGLCYLTQYYR